MAKSGITRKDTRKSANPPKSLPVPAAGSKVGMGVEPALYTGPKGSKGKPRKAGT